MTDRYLVTGCAGFIGARVCQLLLERGAGVVGVDNLNNAYDPQLKIWRLNQLQASNDFVFHAFDIGDRGVARDFFGQNREPRVDAIINLAARAGVRPSVKIPEVYVDTNVSGTLNLLEACRECGIRKFVLASTSSLYGALNPVPFKEDADTNRPLSPYAASKKAAEAMTYSYHHLYGLDVTILRYFTVYGPAGRPDMSIFRFVRQVAEGDEVIMFGDGTQERDFTYVDDIARGTIAGLRPLGFEVINLGGDRPVRMIDILSRIEALVGKQAKVTYAPAHRADVPATWAHIGKARELLEWSPLVPIDEGLQRTVRWYRAEREWAVKISLDDPIA